MQMYGNSEGFLRKISVYEVWDPVANYTQILNVWYIYPQENHRNQAFMDR